MRSREFGVRFGDGEDLLVHGKLFVPKQGAAGLRDDPMARPQKCSISPTHARDAGGRERLARRSRAGRGDDCLERRGSALLGAAAASTMGRT
jgi:hypothetical protein